MLQNWNLMNSSNHRIFKCMGFMPSHYVSAINLDLAVRFSILAQLVGVV